MQGPEGQTGSLFLPFRFRVGPDSGLSATRVPTASTAPPRLLKSRGLPAEPVATRLPSIREVVTRREYPRTRPRRLRGRSDRSLPIEGTPGGTEGTAGPSPENKMEETTAPAPGDEAVEPGTLQYAFSTTGHILVTAPKGELNPEVHAVYQQVSVFFAAATAAFARRNAGLPEADRRSLYDVDTWAALMRASRCFVHLRSVAVQEDVAIDCIDSAEAVARLALGLAWTPGIVGAAPLPFLREQVRGFSREAARFLRAEEGDLRRIGTLFFACEEVGGVPLVSASLLYADCRRGDWAVSGDECCRTARGGPPLTIRQEQFLFVATAGLEEYAARLLRVFGPAASHL